MDSNGKLKLVFVRPVGCNVNGEFEYDLLFSGFPEETWALFWDDNNPSSCGDLTPDYYDKVVRIQSPFELRVIQEMTCYSMEHAINNIVALAWVDINVLEEFPEYRMVLHFGEEENKVSDKIEKLKDNEVD